MKKLPLLFLCVIIILSGCNSGKVPADKFSADFISVNNGIKIKGKILSGSNNALTLSVSSPESMSGYVYKYKGSELLLTYDNLKIESDINYLPDTDFSARVYNVLKSLKKEGNCVGQGSYNSFTEFKGSCDSGEYTLKTYTSSGLIKEISLKENKFNIQFNNIRKMN